MVGPTTRILRHLALASLFVASMPARSFAQASPPPDPGPVPTTSPAAAPAGGAPAAPAPAAPIAPTGTAPPGQAAPRPARAPDAAADPRAPLVAPPATALPRVDPDSDARELARQGGERPGDRPSDVFSEDWWGRTRPVLELHGYFRTRGELFHNFALGRHDVAGTALWPQPLDTTYTDSAGVAHPVRLCGSNPATPGDCFDKSQATANLRLRLNPEFHVSDNLRVLSQIDAIDNLVLGSTPEAGTPYAPSAFFSRSQQAGVANIALVKRAWAEYVTPVGQLRFGRMPDHWGLGMLHNGGDGLDHDYQTTIDRIQFITGLRALDLYFGGSWDFVGSGPATQLDYGTAPYSQGNLVNVDQWSAFIARRANPDLQRLALARGDVVLNAGAYANYRKQLIDVAFGTAADPAAANNGLERRGAEVLVPDLWVQLLWNKLRIEAEAAAVYGSIERFATVQDAKIRQYGVTSQTEFRAVEDKLRMSMGFGWASGDPWVEGLSPRTTGLQQRWGSGPISTFRFNPSYQVDLIFFRRILSRVEGAYYFRPSVEYDFMRSANGQKFGGIATIIWSRASEYLQTPGHRRDLGVELNLSLYYQGKDGALNDNPDKVGGFFAMLQYGVFFPLGGLDYLRGQQTTLLNNWETSSAQTVRLFLGVACSRRCRTRARPPRPRRFPRLRPGRPRRRWSPRRRRATPPRPSRSRTTSTSPTRSRPRRARRARASCSRRIR